MAGLRPGAWMLAAFVSALVAAHPVSAGKADLRAAALPAVVIKGLAVREDPLPNHGRSVLEVSCSLFSTGDNTGVAAAWLDLSGTPLPGKVPLSPDPAGGSPAGERRFSARVPIPFLMDTGGYRFSVKAVDSAGGSSAREAGFSVVLARDPDLPAPGSGEFWELLEQVAGVPATPGNRVEILDEPDRALSRRLSLIHGAGSRIFLESYSLVRDEAGGAILDALVDQADRGVDVRVLLNADSQIPLSPVGTLRLAWNSVLSELEGQRGEKLEAGGLADSLVQFLGKKGQGDGGVRLVLFQGLPRDKPESAGPPPYWLADLARTREAQGDPSMLMEKGPGVPGLPLLDYAVHEKILVADGKRAIVGGRNLEERYFSRWVDLDLFLEGPVVDQVCQGFAESFSQAAAWAGREVPAVPSAPAAQPAGNARAAFVHNRPWEGDYSSQAALALAVACSRERVWCGSQFVILPRGVLADALLDAARRGVDVRVITNSLETTSEVAMGAAWLASIPYKEKLLKAGVRIFEVSGDPDPEGRQPYYHGKEFLFDGRLLAVGSYNLSLRSAYVESENLVFVEDAALCARREEAFLSLSSSRARELTLERLAALREQYKGRMALARKLELLF